MRVLLFHGYLLRGTGSNVYNASIARALAGLGHEVHLACQDREAGDLGAGTPGSVTVHNPEIGGLLPVFVHDTYEGFEVKTFGELSERELERYIELNVSAVRELAESLAGFDAALASHLVMGPVILARAGLGYAVKVHGSDLSYTVLPELERFGPYAREACDGATGILVGSSHIAARLRQAVDDPATQAKVRLGPPGVDTQLFAPIPPSARREKLRRAARRVAAAGVEQGSAARRRDPPLSAWDRDMDAAADAITWFAEAKGPRVIFVGKLIVSKGVDLLLAAWPLIHLANPGARLLIVGFGAYERALEGLWEALEGADLEAVAASAERGRADEGGERARLTMLAGLLCDPPAGYRDAARGAAGSVRFAGRLEHDEVAVPVAASDALVFPSTFPEAFGMVAAEAAAAGVLPVAAHHSGAAEVADELANWLPGESAGLVSFELGPGAVEAIAARVNGWLALPAAGRQAAGEALRDTVQRLWSWSGVAQMVLAAAAGELDRLARPEPQ